MTDKLFFDTDCISAFLWVKEENILFKLYSGKIILPKAVFNELANPSIPHIKRRVKITAQSQAISLGYWDINYLIYTILNMKNKTLK